MKAVILAGGLGTRFSEETGVRPKPMIEIGGRPILWHVMKLYSAFGINDFIVCCGYRGYMIKEYFSNYSLHMSDISVSLRTNEVEIHRRSVEPWTITLIDTGDTTMTGGRLKRVRSYLREEPAFCLTYGDGLGNVDIGQLIEFHNRHGQLATVTGVQPPARFGALVLGEGNRVQSFQEKPEGESFVNGGFFVPSPEVLDYIEGDSTVWEREPLERLAAESQLVAYPHSGFWHPMDTLRDKLHLEELWASGSAPWKLWS